MGGRKADRQNRNMLKRVVALLFALAIIAERASAVPGPVRSLAFHFLRRAEAAARQYVCGAARNCGAPLHWALPNAAREISDREAALALAWWLRILAVGLRDLPRRAFAVRKARLRWCIEFTRAVYPVGLTIDRPISLDTS